MNPRVKVLRVVDGDTVWVRLRVRLPASSPELRDVGGVEAAQRLQKTWRSGRDAEMVIHAVDSFGRVIGELKKIRVQGRRRESSNELH
jgi:endonuclease YncB( thermonuclease family)